jgi:HSP20 family protein
VDSESIDLDVEQNVLTVKAERRPSAGEDAEVLITERPTGSFSRQLFLGDTLDTEHIDAAYDAGVLRLRIPVAVQAKPRKIAISSSAPGRSAAEPPLGGTWRQPSPVPPRGPAASPVRMGPRW